MMGITLILVDLAETGNLVSQPLETKAKHAFTPYLLLESELRARKEAYSHVALSMSKLLLGLLVLVLTAIADNGAQARADWLTQQDPQFGFTYSYPAGLFVPTEGERPSFYYFRSQQTDAKFLVGAWNNDKGATPEEFKRWMDPWRFHSALGFCLRAGAPE
jgi:hypothetical protein